jgi:YVTN family beta-propeller protein
MKWPAPSPAQPLAVGEDSVWVADSSDDTVDRVDPGTNRLAESIAVEHQPEGLAVAGGLVWATLRGG